MKVKVNLQSVSIDVLKRLVILCDLSPSSNFLIPCLLTKTPLTGASEWEKYNPNKKFPPPIVIYPVEVQKIPEVLFFRIAATFALEYPQYELTRSCCLFQLGNDLELELLNYNEGTCLIMSLNGDEDMEKATPSVSKYAPVIRFIADSVENAKREMSGLPLAFYFQLTECISGSGILKSRPPEDQFLIKWPSTCKSGQLVFLDKANKSAGKHQKLLDTVLYNNMKDLFPELQDRECNISDVSLVERKPSVAELTKVSKRIVKKWKFVARLLIGAEEIDRFSIDYNSDVREQAFSALYHWSKQPSASVKTLCNALCDEDEYETAAVVFKLDEERLHEILDRQNDLYCADQPTAQPPVRL